MLLVGNIDFKNNALLDGYDKPVTIKFILPRRLRRRAKVKIKYFGFLHCVNNNQVSNFIEKVHEDFDNTYRTFLARFTPDHVKVSLSSHGEDLMADNVGVEYIRVGTEYVVNEVNESALTFSKTTGAMPQEVSATATLKNNNNKYNRGLWTMCGHNKVYDMTVCDLEESVSEIDVTFKFIRDKTDNSIPQSYLVDEEILIRMATMSIMLELNE